MSSPDPVSVEILAELRRIRQALERSDRELLSIAAAAKRLGVDRAHVGKLVAAGLVEVVRVGSARRVPKSEIERLGREGLPRLERRGRPRKRPNLADENEQIRRLPVW